MTRHCLLAKFLVQYRLFVYSGLSSSYGRRSDTSALDLTSNHRKCLAYLSIQIPSAIVSVPETRFESKSLVAIVSIAGVATPSIDSLRKNSYGAEFSCR